jgi:hypothetical protein
VKVLDGLSAACERYGFASVREAVDALSLGTDALSPGT